MFINSQTQKRVNIYAPYEDAEGNRYGDLLNPGVRQSLGIVEIADPVAPEDYSDGTYFRTEQDDAPYVVYTRKTDEQIRQVQLARIAPISPRQIRQALTRAGLRQQVEAVVQAGDQDMKDWWEFATSFERTHPMVVQAGQALGQTEQQMDDLWRLGAAL